MANSRIDKQLSEDIIAYNKKSKKEMEELRKNEDMLRKLANQAIDDASHDDKGLVETTERTQDGKVVKAKVGVWEVANKTASGISDEMKAFDDFRAAMVSLMHLYKELNAALYYSIGEFLPSMKKIFADLKQKSQIYAAITEGPGIGLDKLGDWIGEQAKPLTGPASEWMDEKKKDLHDWAKSGHNIGLVDSFLQRIANLAATDLTDLQRTLVVQDLLNVIDYNPDIDTSDKFYGPIANLPKTPENQKLLLDIRKVLTPGIELWLKDQGYIKEEETVNNIVKVKYVHDKNGQLDEKTFEKLRFGPDSLESFLSKAFAEDLTSTISPRV